MTKAKPTAAQKKDNEKGRKSLGVHLPDKNEQCPIFLLLVSGTCFSSQDEPWRHVAIAQVLTRKSTNQKTVNVCIGQVHRKKV